MYQAVCVLCLLAFLCFVGCEKVDQAVEAAVKVKAIKSDIEKKADEVRKDISAQADQISEKVREDLRKVPYGEKVKQSDEHEQRGNENGRDGGERDD